MKQHLNKIFFPAAIALLLLASCKKDETKVYFTGGNAPVLTATASDSIPLYASDSTSTAVTFSWTNPNYYFSDGISSLDVTYYLQFDTLGANFTSIYAQKPLAFTSSLTTTLSVSAFNSYLGNQLGLALNQQHNIQVRVESFLSPYTSSSPDAEPLYSNVLNYTVTPYAPPPLVDTPATGELFLVGGDALLGAWENPVPTTQQLTRVSATEYKITIALSGGDPTTGNDQFGLVPQNGSWSGQYGALTANLNSTGSPGGPFNLANVSGYNTNFPGPTAAGTYILDFNFQNGTYSLTKQ